MVVLREISLIFFDRDAADLLAPISLAFLKQISS